MSEVQEECDFKFKIVFAKERYHGRKEKRQGDKEGCSLGTRTLLPKQPLTDTQPAEHVNFLPSRYNAPVLSSELRSKHLGNGTGL